MAIELVADARDRDVPLRHFWSACVGAGRAAEGLRAGWQEQLRTVIEACGFSYVRFHGLFHDDMFVFRLENEHAVYNFQYVDDLFDRLLDADIRPFVEFGFSPSALARKKNTVFWWGAHGAPPMDYETWAELVERTVRHWIDRYGLDEVREWYFEVWNEPNLLPFFAGTRSEYFELYRATARTLRRIDDGLRVGGPATSNFVPDDRFEGETEDPARRLDLTGIEDLSTLEWRPVWIVPFLEFCAREDLPVDFVSCHPYPSSWALDDHGESRHYTREAEATATDLHALRRLVDASPFPDAEIHLTEWSSTPSSRDHAHDHLPAAAFIVKANLESIGLVDSLAYWTFTDVFEEAGAGDSVFHGGFGLLNYQGVAKPAFHAYRLLHKLGDRLVQRRPGGVVTRHSFSGRLTALAYHYPIRLSLPLSSGSRAVAEETLAMGRPERLRLEWTNLAPGTSVLIETLDARHGNALAAWKDMGEPEPPDRAQTMELRKAAMATHKEVVRVDPGGTLTLDRPIDPWSIVLVDQL